MGEDKPEQQLVSMVQSGSMALITLTRAAQANAYNQVMLAEMVRMLDEAEVDSCIRTIVFTGEGERAFSSGADRHEIAVRDWRSVLSLKSAALFERIRKSPKVTLAAINGVAVGGGLELALSCDIRLALPHARFWLPEAEFGLIPAAAATRLLPRTVGALRAKDLVLGGVKWDAADAMGAGLLSEIASEGALMDCVAKWVNRIERRDADAIWLAKQALEMSSSGADTSQFDLLAQALLVQLQANRTKDTA
jgi:enoyl-CoA hydratase/carnithine racemase